MRRFCIIHFQPLEKYPPTVNFLRFLSGKVVKDCEIDVITTGTMHYYWELKVPGMQIMRLIWWQSSANRLRRSAQYLIFCLRSLFHLIRRRPAAVLYYESLSAFAPWFYKKYINRKASIFIHYHEYTSPEEYLQGMVLNRALHQKERFLYKDAWVSHTNQTRMDMFLRDMGASKPEKVHIFPNYPPASWFASAKDVKRHTDPRIGFVYVGALSMDSMYTREMATFVANYPDQCYWDIFSDNHQPEVVEFLNSLQASNITFRGSVPYGQLPAVLPAYDIGVILYKGVSANHIHSVPNKLFEYLVCGLNVWYPPVLEGMRPYEQQLGKPWVIAVDFAALKLPAVDQAMRVAVIHPSSHSADNVYADLWSKIVAEAG